jgi:tetratricopeptide (TPR) repeat protein
VAAVSRGALLAFALSAALLIRGAAVAQPQQLPPDMHGWAQASIELVFKEDYRGAEEEAKKILRAYPDHPAGYFFMAAVADAWMQRYQSNKREAEFYKFCDQAVEKAEKILAANPGDDWARFFMGGAEGYKGTFEARYERYITAFRYGWKGVSIFLKMASGGSKNPDINFGIGTYDYWRSALMKMLWWMPGVEDKRAVGIEKLKGVIKDGVYTRAAAGCVLIDVYMNENRFGDALDIASAMCKKYPRAVSFMWGRAAALHGLKRYEEAAAVYKAIYAKCENDPNANRYNAVKARMGMAKAYIVLGKNAEALEQVNAVSGYQLSKDIKKRLDPDLAEADRIRKRAGGGKGGGGEELASEGGGG